MLFLGRGGRKVPAHHNSKTIHGIEIKFGTVVENHKLINLVSLSFSLSVSASLSFSLFLRLSVCLSVCLCLSVSVLRRVFHIIMFCWSCLLCCQVNGWYAK